MFTPEFFSALSMIIMINIVLSGDNAVVIAIASRRLPAAQRKKAIFTGTFLAVIVRVIATVAAAYLLKIPFLYLIGGLILIWIAYKLLAEEEDSGKINSSDNLIQAVKTIVIADIMMGLDNVIAIAGAAQGNLVLIVLGLLISVPLMIFGSQLILKAMERFPWILYIGSAVLALAAADMIVNEKALHWMLPEGSWIANLFKAAVIAGVLILGKRQRDNYAKKHQERAAASGIEETA